MKPLRETHLKDLSDLLRRMTAAEIAKLKEFRRLALAKGKA